MLPQYHFSLGLVASLFLYFGFDIELLGCFIFLVATVGIDVDHYLYYVYRKRDWNLINAIRWFMQITRGLKKMDIKIRREFYTGFCFLHGIEVLAITALLGYFVWDLFYFIVLGFLFHLILDHINQAFWRGRFDKFSIIYDYFKYGKLKFVDELEELTKLVENKLK